MDIKFNIKQMSKGSLNPLVFLVGLLLSFSVSAVPVLQVNIEDGYYAGCPDATTCSGSEQFNVFTYLKPDNQGKNTLADTYRISMAVTPKITLPTDLGSFVFAGNTIQVTDDMTFGVAPIETAATQLFDPGDLGDHGIFDTYFTEFEFMFVAGQESAAFNVQDNPGDTPSDHPGTGMFFQSFMVDTTLLDPSVEIHFDLYNVNICTDSQGQCNLVNDADISQFAPFSHDAQSSDAPPSPGPGPIPGVPEPNIMALMALGLLAGVYAKRREMV